MKRGSPLKRSELRRSSSLPRGGGPRAVSGRRQAENRQRRRMVVEVFGVDPACFVCGQPAQDAHELLSRARGGSITDPDNVRPVCRPCHSRITTEPVWAESNGYALSRYTPTKETL